MKQCLQCILFLVISATYAQEQFTVYFDFDIDEANTPSGSSLAQWIAVNKGVQIQKLYGYADKTGNPLYNTDLSQRRAAYVAQQLKDNRVMFMADAEVKGFGEEFSTSAYNAKDRKVVIYFTQPNPGIAEAPKPVATLSSQITTAKVGDKIRLKNMNFYNMSDVMLPVSKPVLEELLAILRDNPTLKIDIQGHVCCEPETSIKISLRRALAVYRFLIANGISESRLSYKSFGNTRPIHPIPEKSEAEKVANRRVEIEILEK